MLIIENVDPIDTIYYILGCILKEVMTDNQDLDELFEKLKTRNKRLKYRSFLLALNFLYLINKVTFDDGIIKYN